MCLPGYKGAKSAPGPSSAGPRLTGGKAAPILGQPSVPTTPADHAITALLQAWGDGDLAARDRLFPLLLDESLDELAALSPDQARLVELRYFGGLTTEEAAEVLGVSHATVERKWNLARAWLFRRVTQGRPS